MKTIVEGLASRDFILVSTKAMSKVPLQSLSTNVNGGCDCDGDCGQGDCDCPSGPDSGDDDG